MKLGVIGGGAMAEAIIAGVLKAGLYTPTQIRVSEPQPQRRDYWQEHYGVQTTADNQATGVADWLLLAIKPQVFREVVNGLTFPLAAQGVISVLAGVPVATLVQAFPGVAVVRAMPNTPALIGAGVTALCGDQRVTPAMWTDAEAIFRAVGTVVRVPESLMDAVTGLSGSGPAYVALIAEALMDGGVAAGLPRAIARDLVLQTISGSVELMVREQLHPAQLKDRVTSPGGTTIAGLAALESSGVRGACIQAVLQATARARELGLPA